MKTLITDDFQVFIKPIGARCNLQCSYCYYLPNTDIFKPDVNPIMTNETLENYIQQHYLASTSDTVLFTWHGGEPLLAGIEFYEKALSIQRKYLPAGKSFVNAIQTNGTMLTKEWCEFLAANKFSVGISMDGPETFHNAMRHTPNKSGSFEKTLRGYHLLREQGITAEILCVVNAFNVRYPLAVYEFFKSLGTKYISFLPLVERINKENSQVSPESVPAFEFGLFLAAVFDEWVKSDIGTIKIQIIEEALRTAFHQEHSLCIFRECCGGIPVIEHNGDFYSCDHYVGKNQSLGNINEHPLAYWLNHPVQKAFGDTKRDTLPQYCIRCEVRDMCNGECPKNRFITSPDGEPGLNYLCDGYDYFFNHIKPFVLSVAEAWKKNHS
ncbi:anaerobic sulfatase maturase [Parabacteroides sp. OttesenSCG-928-G07]|nr:anaerobic sulfatase maturase [Parabacteroides sp. OttesenSCG-928-G21]MDL2278675.1 anaerobic sulfatase maturase [Parabacteroides sp. OttesenSCG-928-G07]